MYLWIIPTRQGLVPRLIPTYHLFSMVQDDNPFPLHHPRKQIAPSHYPHIRPDPICTGGGKDIEEGPFLNELCSTETYAKTEDSLRSDNILQK